MFGEFIEELTDIKCGTCGADVLTYRDFISAYNREYFTDGVTSFSFYCHSCRNLTTVKVGHWDINHYRGAMLSEEGQEKLYKRFSSRRPEQPIKTGWLDFGYEKRMRKWREANEAYDAEALNEIHQESRELKSYIENGLQDALKKRYPPVQVTPCECCLGSGVHKKESEA